MSKTALASALLAFALTGCLETATQPDNGISFSGFPASVPATPSSPAKVSGTINAGKALDSVVVTVIDASGASMTRNKYGTSGKTQYTVDALDFSFSATACNGTYKAQFTAFAGTDSKSQSVDISLSGAKDCNGNTGTPLSAFNLSAGAQSNASLGSSIDLDAPKVMLASAARAASAEVDLVYANSFADDADMLWSPSSAKDNVTFMDNWSVYNTTQFHKVSGTSFDAVTTAEELAALWKPASAVTTGLAVVAGDLVIARSDKGKLVLIQIASQVPGETGSINMKVAK